MSITLAANIGKRKRNVA